LEAPTVSHVIQELLTFYTRPVHKHALRPCLLAASVGSQGMLLTHSCWLAILNLIRPSLFAFLTLILFHVHDWMAARIHPPQ